MQTDKEKERVERVERHAHICRALVTSSESEEYDFDCMAMPVENGQLRKNYDNGEYYYEVLMPFKENIVTSRMDSGLPLFDNHPWDLSAMNTLGITVGYEFTPEGIRMMCKWGARADEALRSDVKNQILKTMSIEADIHEYTIERKPGMLPTYYATRWEPTSLSIAPVPQDIASQIEVKRAIQKQIEKPETGKSIIQSIISKF